MEPPAFNLTDQQAIFATPRQIIAKTQHTNPPKTVVRGMKDLALASATAIAQPKHRKGVAQEYLEKQAAQPFPDLTSVLLKHHWSECWSD
jgi:hypothetical protein